MTRQEYQLRIDTKGKQIDKSELINSLDKKALGERMQSRMSFVNKSTH